MQKNDSISAEIFLKLIVADFVSKNELLREFDGSIPAFIASILTNGITIHDLVDFSEEVAVIGVFEKGETNAHDVVRDALEAIIAQQVDIDNAIMNRGSSPADEAVVDMRLEREAKIDAFVSLFLNFQNVLSYLVAASNAVLKTASFPVGFMNAKTQLQKAIDMAFPMLEANKTPGA